MLGKKRGSTFPPAVSTIVIIIFAVLLCLLLLMFLMGQGEKISNIKWSGG